MAQICLVNLTELNPPTNGGTARVARAVCQMLMAQQDPRLAFVFIVNWKFTPFFPAWLGTDKATIIPYIESHRVPSLAALFRKLEPDFIISPLFGMKPFDQPGDFPGVPHVTAVPDALALDHPELFPGTQNRSSIYEPLKHAARIVAVSEYSRGRLLHHLKLDPARVVVAYHGADVLEVDAALQTVPQALPPNPFVLYPANDWPHKRHDLLFQVMMHIWQQRPALNLVLTGGRNPQTDRIPELMRRYNCPPERVFDLGYVSNAQLKALYQQAEAMLFTSAHEGFGMPLMEAMQNRCPVLCAPVTAIPEIAGDAALYVESDEAAVWVRAFLETLPQQRDSLIEKGVVRAAQFTWDTARAQWARILMEAGLQLELPPEDAPLPIEDAPLPGKFALLDARVAALRQQYQQLIDQRQLTIGDLPMSILKTHLEKLEQLRQRENNSALVNIPVIGMLIRLLWRVRYLGMMWHANIQMHTALIARIQDLEARLDALENDQDRL